MNMNEDNIKLKLRNELFSQILNNITFFYLIVAKLFWLIYAIIFCPYSAFIFIDIYSHFY